VVLTDPTTGGVTASYAMLGDIHIAEPGALICFAGPRVIQQTIREQLPEGFQRAEYLLAHGMVDMVVHRHQLTETLATIVRLLTSGTAPTKSAKADRDKTARPHGYVNGVSVDGKLLENLARSGDGVDAEPVEPTEHFEPNRIDTRPKTARDGEATKPRLPKDGARS